MAGLMIGDARLAGPLRMCRGCGCTDLEACPGGCSWVLLDIAVPTGVCSRCAEDNDFDQMFLASCVEGVLA